MLYDHSKALKLFMAENNTTNKELAEFCGVTSQKVTHWRTDEVEQISFRYLGKICQFFNISLSEFIKRGE